MAEFFSDLKLSPNIRPMYNLGATFDIPWGRPYVGKYGETIVNGGLRHFTAICARGNMFKTVVMFFMFLQVLDRYIQAKGVIYDTEMTFSLLRLRDMTVNMINSLMDEDIENSPRIKLTDKVRYNGTDWFEWLKAATETRSKMEKDDCGTTPFLDAEGNNIKALYPLLSAIDSLSTFAAGVVAKVQDSGGVGDSSRNVEALRDAASKTQMILELPALTAKNGIFMMMTVHVGDNLALDPYAPPQKKLHYMKNKLTFKNAPEKLTFLANDCWHISSAETMINQNTKAVEFPRDQADSLDGDTDLMRLKIMNLRGKSGPSGLPFEIVVSQSDGLHVGLTEFNYIREYNRFGLDGNDRNYFLDLHPDQKLSRTTIRGKIDEDPLLQRALQITSELFQIQTFWRDTPNRLRYTPKELYEGLKQKGYDWEQLLGTRGYWTFDNDKQEKPFLSTPDLLNMMDGTYKPYWM